MLYIHDLSAFWPEFMYFKFVENKLNVYIFVRIGWKNWNRMFSNHQDHFDAATYKLVLDWTHLLHIEKSVEIKQFIEFVDLPFFPPRQDSFILLCFHILAKIAFSSENGKEKSRIALRCEISTLSFVDPGHSSKFSINLIIVCLDFFLSAGKYWASSLQDEICLF